MWKSRLTFAFVVLCLLALALFHPEKEIAFIGLYALLLLVLSSLLGVLFAPIALRIEEKTNTHELSKKEALHYTCRIVNRSPFFYPRVECAYYTSELIDHSEKVCAVLPFRYTVLENTVQFPYRGIYAMGIRRVTVTDALGLFRLRFPMDHPIRVTVLPAADEAFIRFVRAESQQTSMRRDRFNESYADVADVRQYTGADHFRRIHWAASARRGELMVKTFEVFEPKKLVLFVDPMQLPLNAAENAAFSDKVVSVAAAALEYCIDSHQPASLSVGSSAEEWLAVEDAENADAAYRLLARLQFAQPKSQLPDFLAGLERDAVSYHLLLFLPRLDAHALDALAQFSTYDDTICLYVFSSAQMPLNEAQQTFLSGLYAEGIQVQYIDVGQAVTNE